MRRKLNYIFCQRGFHFFFIAKISKLPKKKTKKSSEVQSVHGLFYVHMNIWESIENKFFAKISMNVWIRIGFLRPFWRLFFFFFSFLIRNFKLIRIYILRFTHIQVRMWIASALCAYASLFVSFHFSRLSTTTLVLFFYSICLIVVYYVIFTNSIFGPRSIRILKFFFRLL